ncbi:uncharacterized protein ARMOST_02751 [Armillaria ostoyae]|uniref:Uncharacterized protein n=1 Tax=Armillaria ostoyae TaxID=47428 RepID=A0A284QSJ9_ARMOS|nr:uncharacterized protein ARMOST_02751 [Armillaria ostoyae]
MQMQRRHENRRSTGLEKGLAVPRRSSSSQYIHQSLEGDHEFDMLELGACSPALPIASGFSVLRRHHLLVLTLDIPVIISS